MDILFIITEVLKEITRYSTLLKNVYPFRCTTINIFKICVSNGAHPVFSKQFYFGMLQRSVTMTVDWNKEEKIVYTDNGPCFLYRLSTFNI